MQASKASIHIIRFGAVEGSAGKLDRGENFASLRIFHLPCNRKVLIDHGGLDSRIQRSKSRPRYFWQAQFNRGSLLCSTGTNIVSVSNSIAAAPGAAVSVAGSGS